MCDKAVFFFWLPDLLILNSLDSPGKGLGLQPFFTANGVNSMVEPMGLDPMILLVIEEDGASIDDYVLSCFIDLRTLRF